MRTSIKLAAFGGGLVLVFGAALGIGAAVGNPVSDAGVHGERGISPTPAPSTAADTGEHGSDGRDHGGQEGHS